MAEPIGGNLLAAAAVTYSPAPNASFAAGVIYYVDDALSDYATTATMVVDNQTLDIETFYFAYTGWSGSAGQTAAITIDIGEARGGDQFSIDGWYGTSSYYRPTDAHLEYSDNGSSWTTVANRTGLTGGGQPGAHGWRIEWDVSGSGDHRYWRITLTLGGANLLVCNARLE